MDRFVAMIWDEADESRKAQVNLWSETLQRKSARWTIVLDAPGLRVLSLIHRGDAPVVTVWQGQDGVIVGPIFARGREKNGRVRVFDEREAERVVSTRGDSLIKDYWGSYVACWRDIERRCTTVLRDPCGAVPCFMTRHGGVDLLFAHADDVGDLLGLSFSVDWQYLQAFLLFNFFVTKHTGLNEVKELLGGERMELRATGERSFSWAWNGTEIAATPSFQSFHEAKAELRATAEDCFVAWGKEYRKIVVSLSGGLDSSILVNLLRSVSDVEVTALHYVGKGYEQYEVLLARLAAERANVRLVEATFDPATEDLARKLNIPKLARPTAQVLCLLGDEFAADVADNVGADAFMMGQGGDNLFLQRAIAGHTLADYLLLRGFGADFWRIAYDAAMLKRISLWEAVGDALSIVFTGQKWQPFEFLDYDLSAKHRPLSSDAVRAVSNAYKSHPWINEAMHLPRGKGDHLVNIVALYNYYLNHGSSVIRDMVYPFMSQPILEMAIRTPTYVLCHDGVDRGIERHAFGDLIPAEIMLRTGKGGGRLYSRQVIHYNLGFFREIIMDGDVMRRGWLDRKKVERMLKPEYAAHGGGSMYMYFIAAAEVWIRSWRGSGAHSVA
jgi:asparagine synthase (glutamine-hydrolysing)